MQNATPSRYTTLRTVRATLMAKRTLPAQCVTCDVIVANSLARFGVPHVLARRLPFIDGRLCCERLGLPLTGHGSLAPGPLRRMPDIPRPMGTRARCASYMATRRSNCLLGGLKYYENRRNMCLLLPPHTFSTPDEEGKSCSPPLTKTASPGSARVGTREQQAENTLLARRGPRGQAGNHCLRPEQVLNAPIPLHLDPGS